MVAGWPMAVGQGAGAGSVNSLGEFHQQQPSPLPNHPYTSTIPRTSTPSGGTPTAPPTAPPTANRKNQANASSGVVAGGRSPKLSKKNLPSTPNVRLKRLTNTDNVYTLTQTADGDKFRCKACHRCFNLKCTLLRHVRHQHQGRFVPHPCPQCGQVFKRTDHLKVHLKKIHGVETVSRANRSQSPNVTNDNNSVSQPDLAQEDSTEPASPPSSGESNVKTEWPKKPEL